MPQGIPAWVWVVFGVVLVVLLALDLFVHRGERGTTKKSAIHWTVIWIVAGLAFGGLVWWQLGGAAAGDYLAAYLIEKSLSLDNLFVFLIIFANLGIPKEHQHTVLTWGVLGALGFRALFIFVGTEALQHYDWVVYVFGGILVLAAIRTFREHPLEVTENKAVRWLSRHLPVTHEVHGNDFFVRLNGRRVVTPLLIALIAIELTDIVFAIDSVPAAFSVTREPFIVYSSNAFAILGLRALYLVLAHTIAHLKYLHYGLGAVLLFAAAKLIGEEWVHVPAWLSILIIAVLISVAWIASVIADKRGLVPHRPDIEAVVPDGIEPPNRDRPSYVG